MRDFGKIINLTLAAALIFTPLPATNVRAADGGGLNSSAAAFGVIRGSIRDDRGGAPIAGAVVALWRDGMASVRQIRSAADGSFVARVLPGRYSLTAMAEGYSVVSLSNVDVARADDVAFRFNLTQVGSGKTLPERKAERSSAKWRLRSNAARRSIFQNSEGTGETIAGLEEIEDAIEENAVAEDDERSSTRRDSQSVVETYFAAASNAQATPYFGLNFATVQPVNEKLDLVFAGQTGVGEDAPQRFESAVKLKLNERHRVSFNFGGARLGKVQLDETSDAERAELGQISFQALDEWRVRDNVILVLGVDYARFIGASDADSLNPRIGLQLETDAKTRFNFAYTAQTEQRTWQQAAELEDARVMFRQPNFESFAVADRQVLMPRMRRLEFGVERVLDNSSNLEATAFFDATTNRGISFVELPVAAFGEESPDFSTAVQNGAAQGVRVVYSRRFNSVLSGSLGYAAGRGQMLSADGLQNPAHLFDDAFFQTLAAQLSANFDSGTEVRAVWRRSPRGAVFAIDPFAGRIAFFEPSVSVLVTQNLPSLGLPLRAKATLDARNLFDLQTDASDGETTLRLNQSRRFLRGGIAVRF